MALSQTNYPLLPMTQQHKDSTIGKQIANWNMRNYLFMRQTDAQNYEVPAGLIISRQTKVKHMQIFFIEWTDNARPQP